MFLSARPSLLLNRIKAQKRLSKSTRWAVGNRQRREKSTSPGHKYWVPERLDTDPKYPLSEQVKKYTHPSLDDKPTRNKSIHVRTQIVSPGLCDDVLSYIGPSLEKHKGCDIVDLNPGAGLWSSKLHDFIQPRSHILLEPDVKRFKDFLDPLVNQPDSTYKIVERNPCDFSVFSELLDNGYLPHQKRVISGDPKAQEPNNSLLVTGQLIWDPRLPGAGFDSMAKQVLLHYANAMWTNEVWHAVGPVRMLLWIAKDDFKHMLPRTQHVNAKSSFWLQQTSHVTEVVAPGHEVRSINSSDTREHRYRLESLALALKRGKQNGVELPAHRREDVHDFVEELLRKTDGTAITSASESTAFLKEQFKKGKSVQGLLPNQILEVWQFEKDMNFDEIGITTYRGGREVVKLPKQYSKDPEMRALWKSMTVRRANVNRLETQRKKRDATVELGDQIYQLECKILGFEDGSQAKKDALEELQTLQKQFEDEIQDTDTNVRTTILTDLDDRWTIRSPVERLLWDTRPYEPLVMQPSEAWPSKPVSLVDVTPRVIPKGESIELFEWVKDFTFGLLFNPRATLPDALEKMQPGASEIIEQAPSLRIPEKGGRLNLNNMRVRMLTPEMVLELTKAYQEWPFRTEDYHSSYFKLKAGNASRKAHIAEF